VAGPAVIHWRLRRLRVCGSTERELDRWLSALALADRCDPAAALPLAVRAERQRHGHGQQGRIWHAPRGGIWLSAALPWPAAEGAALGLAVAVGLALQLEGLGLDPRIKWPNDLLVHGRKLAGLLPRLRLRGDRVRWARVGIGVNGVNRVPAGAISLAEALASPQRRGQRSWHPLASPRRLERRVLAALDWAMTSASDAERVRLLAEQRLWRPAGGFELEDGRWPVDGLERNGALRLRRGTQVRRIERHF
jgi:BirA family biotin operon repressor/biotin-[acetyl-CoA-carboxylase] ligase